MEVGDDFRNSLGWRRVSREVFQGCLGGRILGTDVVSGGTFDATV